MSPRWNWDSPTPLAASECALPLYQRVGGHTRLLLKGWGSPNSNGETLSTLPTLCLPLNSARIYRPSIRKNKPKTLVFSHRKRAFWACFREYWVYNFGHRKLFQGIATMTYVQQDHTLG
jgi:hypothetical protein